VKLFKAMNVIDSKNEPRRAVIAFKFVLNSAHKNLSVLPSLDMFLPSAYL
jgi:hypothetical protein